MYSNSLIIILAGISTTVVAQSQTSVADIVSQVGDGQIQETASVVGITTTLESDEEPSTTEFEYFTHTDHGDYETSTSTAEEEANTTIPEGKTSENGAISNWSIAAGSGSLAAVLIALLM